MSACKHNESVADGGLPLPGFAFVCTLCGAKGVQSKSTGYQLVWGGHEAEHAAILEVVRAGNSPA